MPEITPVLGWIVNPGGKVPPSEKVRVSPSGSPKNPLTFSGAMVSPSSLAREAMLPIATGRSLTDTTVMPTVAVSVTPPELTV